MSTRLLVAIALGLAVILALLLANGSEVSGNQMASLAAAGACIALISTWVVAHARGNLGGTLRDLLIWGVIIAGVAFVYSIRTQLGF